MSLEIEALLESNNLSTTVASNMPPSKRSGATARSTVLLNRSAMNPRYVIRRPLAVLLVILLLVTVAILSLGYHRRHRRGVPFPIEGTPARGQTNVFIKASNLSGKHDVASRIVHGTVMDVAYSHCRRSIGSTENAEAALSDLVLLHGAKFTKLDWEDIMNKFCTYEGVAVTAFDLNVHAKFQTLLDLLQASRQHEISNLDDAAVADTAAKHGPSTTTLLQSTIPVAALVTPSASGSIVLEGLLDVNDKGYTQELHRVVQRWFPVAVNAVLVHSVADLTARKGDVFQWPHITAVYGNLDVNGKRSSERLQEAAAIVAVAAAAAAASSQSTSTVDVVELPGTHPVYLDAPDAFVETVLQYVSLDKK